MCVARSAETMFFLFFTYFLHILYLSIFVWEDDEFMCRCKRADNKADEENIS